MAYTNLNGKSPLKLSNNIEIISGTENGVINIIKKYQETGLYPGIGSLFISSGRQSHLNVYTGNGQWISIAGEQSNDAEFDFKGLSSSFGLESEIEKIESKVKVSSFGLTSEILRGFSRCLTSTFGLTSEILRGFSRGVTSSFGLTSEIEKIERKFRSSSFGLTSECTAVKL